MARKTSEELRQKANRMDAIEALKQAIAALREGNDGKAMGHMDRAEALLGGNAAEAGE